MVRYGTALAFFVKSMLVSTVIVCYRQRIWHTLRRKAMTINGIDGLFSATEDPTMFFLNWEMVRNGKLATLMAVYPTGTRNGFFDYYDQPSKIARRLAFSSAYLKKAQAREKAAVEFCGQGWNCTYSINFMAPGYKCDDISEAVPSNAPFNIDEIAPNGDFIYHAEVDQGDYKRPQVPTTEGVPADGPPYPTALGVFQSEPVLWVGYAENTSNRYDDDSPYAKKWTWVHEPKMFSCILYETNYTFEMRYRPTQNATLKQRDFLYPVVNTTLLPDPTNNGTLTADPSSSFISPQNSVPTYKLAAAYHSMGAMLRNFLRGNIEKTSDTFIITRSDISETRLMDGRTSYPQPNLMEAVQSLFEDMLLTLLSEPTLVAAETVPVECLKSRTMLVRILVTTRNPTLDHLSIGACLGGDPFPKELRETKLRFGVLLEDEPREGPLGKVEHCCFGTRGETKDIIKGNNYAGLWRWKKDDGGGSFSEETRLLGSVDELS
ncbi:hypothetical protein N0V94_003712 [Neodidymelliopsis sp. IMI 364377]|nr:hypothetical protein N0V94_003712 [Neodidymelliopsis sp. IMI 364377]